MQTTESTALARLNQIVEEGKMRAKGGMEALAREYQIRRDLMVRPEAIDVEIEADQIRLVIGGQRFALTNYSRAQLLERARIPQTFAATLLERELGELLRFNLQKLLPNVSADGVLVRTVPQSEGLDLAKGVLSSSYRRMDAAPIFEAYAAESLRAGLVPYHGEITETRAFLSFVRPEVTQIANDEYVVIGTELRASDYGRGALQLALHVVRLLCRNGMVGMDLLRRVHLGRRFDAAEFAAGGPMITLSRKTIDLDTRAVRSALSDTVRGVHGHMRALEAALKEHATDGIDVAKALSLLKSKNMRKSIVEKAAGLYEQKMPIEALPPEPGRWRFANVLSLIANGEQGDTAADLRDVAFEAMFPAGAPALRAAA